VAWPQTAFIKRVQIVKVKDLIPGAGKGPGKQGPGQEDLQASTGYIRISKGQ
jgi:hypothetical protein